MVNNTDRLHLHINVHSVYFGGLARAWCQYIFCLITPKLWTGVSNYGWDSIFGANWLVLHHCEMDWNVY